MSNQDRVDEIKRKVIMLNNVSPTFCLAKWLQTTTTLYNGMTHSCHHPVQHKINAGDLSKSSTALHNTPQKLQARQDMLSGVQTPECDYCWKSENLGNEHLSDRHYKSANMGMGIWPRFDEVVASGLGENINPSYLEVAFENICNFKCSYCSPDVSSRWMEEIQQHGPYKLDPYEHHNLDWMKQTGRFPIHHAQPNPYIDKFWEWWPELYKTLTAIRVTGGEPLLSKNTWRLIDEVLANPREDFRLDINTNMGVPQALVYKLARKVTDLQEKIAQVCVFTSLESYGKAAEYSRFGMDWDLFRSNVDYFMMNTPDNVQLIFMTTVNVLSVDTFDKFLTKLMYWREKYCVDRGHNRVGFSVSYLRWPTHQCLTNLDDGAKRYFAERMEDTIHVFEPDDSRMGSFYLEEVDQIKRLVEFMNSQAADPREQANFVRFFDEYDRRRNTSLLGTHPRLQVMYDAGKSNGS